MPQDRRSVPGACCGTPGETSRRRKPMTGRLSGTASPEIVALRGTERLKRACVLASCTNLGSPQALPDAVRGRSLSGSSTQEMFAAHIARLEALRGERSAAGSSDKYAPCIGRRRRCWRAHRRALDHGGRAPVAADRGSPGAIILVGRPVRASNKKMKKTLAKREREALAPQTRSTSSAMQPWRQGRYVAARRITEAP